MTHPLPRDRWTFLERLEPLEWLLMLLRLLLGAILMIAAGGKMHYPFIFADAIGGFRILHESIRFEVALIVIWQELIIGTLLVLGVWSRAAAGLASGLLLVYALAVASAVLRGLEFDCRCFGDLVDGRVDWTLVLRALELSLVAYIVARWGGGKAQLESIMPSAVYVGEEESHA